MRGRVDEARPRLAEGGADGRDAGHPGVEDGGGGSSLLQGDDLVLEDLGVRVGEARVDEVDALAGRGALLAQGDERRRAPPPRGWRRRRWTSGTPPDGRSRPRAAGRTRESGRQFRDGRRKAAFASGSWPPPILRTIAQPVVGRRVRIARGRQARPGERCGLYLRARGLSPHWARRPTSPIRRKIRKEQFSEQEGKRNDKRRSNDEEYCGLRANGHRQPGPALS